MNINYSKHFFFTAVLLVGISLPIPGAVYAAEVQIDSNELSGLSYRLVGPMRGGRATRVAGISGDPATYYFGTAAGGVWKTTDGGITWFPIFDGQPVSAIGDIALAPSDPDIIYVATGDAKSRGNDSHGNGVYKSIDAGATWQHMGLSGVRQTSRVIIHPEDPDVVLVAAQGGYYGPGKHRGIFRSRDGGRTWKKVLYVDEHTGAYDVDFVPGSPDKLYATTWQMLRNPFNLASGGPGSGLFYSSDSGDTWKRLQGNGLPDGVLGKIGVAISPADPNRIYAVVEAEKGGLYRSDDSGINWKYINPSRALWRRAWFFMDIIPHPLDPDTIFVLNIQLEKSVDAGESFTPMKTNHVDHHDLWIDPGNPQRMFSGNDGGANVSVNGGLSWARSDDNQPTGQFYRVITDDRFPYFIYGGQQDWETIAIASRGNWNGIGYRDWYPVGGCEMGWAAPDKRTSNYVYAGCTDGGISRYDRKTRRNQSVDPWPLTNIGHGAKDARFRFQWTSPILVSHHEPSVMYSGANMLLQSGNDGMNWEVISGDLTRDDKSKQEPSGGPISRDNVGTEVYGTIYALAESRLKKDLLWVGTDDGLVHVTETGGNKWQNVTPSEKLVPEWSRINSIEASRHDPATAYLSIHRREWNEYRPYVLKTTNYGADWELSTNGLPEDTIVRVLREDPGREGLLFLGTEMGMYFSLDGGNRWQSLQLNLPVTPVYDLTIKDNDLVVATHGRAFWVLDDISPLRTLTAELAAKPSHVFPPSPTVRIRDDFSVPATPSGRNPPPGAVIYYNLGKIPADPVTISIIDSAGNTVHSFSSAPATGASLETHAAVDLGAYYSRSSPVSTEPGLNRFVWDLRHRGPTGIAGSVIFWHPPKTPPVGPLALPGEYKIRMEVDGIVSTAALTITADPRIAFPVEELRKQFDLHIKVRDTLSEISEAVLRVRRVYDQIDRIRSKSENNKEADSVNMELKKLRDNLMAVEYALTEPRMQGPSDSFHFPVRLDNQLTLLIGTIANSDRAPTHQAYEVYEVLKGRGDEQLKILKKYLENDVPDLNKMLGKAGLSPINLGTL